VLSLVVVISTPGEISWLCYFKRSLSAFEMTEVVVGMTAGEGMTTGEDDGG
jgi:hypothetical protein